MTHSIQLDERLVELELALENADWVRMGFDADYEFSRDGVRRITQLARLNYIKNPLIKRGVDIQTYYVFGRGVSISAKDEAINNVIQAFIDDRSNQSELTSPQARKARDKELRVDGNLFFVFFVQPNTGNIRVSTLPLDEITDIIRDPDNRKRNLFYKREWDATRLDYATGEQKIERQTRYYRDFRNMRDVARIGDIEVDQTCAIYHVKVGAFQDWAFGISEVYAALDWARAYKGFLEDFAKIVKSLARFAWRKKTGGGAAGVAAARTKLNSTFAREGTAVETTPSPIAGSVMIETGSEQLDPISTKNTTTSASEGKELRLMSGIAMGLPDHIASGDMAQGTLATAKSLDRPTEFQFADRQELWVGVYQTILDYVVYNAVVAPDGALRGVGDVTANTYGEQVVTFPDEVVTTIEVDFPSLIEHDLLQRIQAIISGATFDGKTPTIISDRKLLAKTILSDLGFDDIDEIVDGMYPKGYEDDDLVPQDDPLMAALDNVNESLRSLTEALKTPSD